MRKLVSVITGTYDRPRELLACINEVRKQTYPFIEHCIVHDGPAAQIIRDIVSDANNDSNVPIKFVETGRQWSHFLAMSISAVPFQVAQWLSSGDYIMWLSDDEEITEDHIESLVDLLEEKDVDFVYSKTEVWFHNSLQSSVSVATDIIGADIPKSVDITQALFRAELLDYRGFMTHIGSRTDWDQVSHWMEAGASWAFLDRITHTHRVDKLGDRALKQERQPLKGWKNG
jgi:glycosyltransferase involved in cell wall biosynthesis